MGTNCIVEVTMDVTLCGSGPNVYITYFSEVEVEILIFCGKPTAESIQDSYNAFVDQFMADLLVSGIEDYNCNTGQVNLTSNYSQITCTQTCIRKEGDRFVWRDLSCANEQGCCVHFKHWCLQADGEPYVLLESKNLEVECSDFIQPENAFCIDNFDCSITNCE